MLAALRRELDFRSIALRTLRERAHSDDASGSRALIALEASVAKRGVRSASTPASCVTDAWITGPRVTEALQGKTGTGQTVAGRPV
jgi:hypothetical protein